MTTTYMLQQGGKLFYGTSASPSSLDAAAQVTKFREVPSQDQVAIPGTFSQAPFDVPVGNKLRLEIEFLDDSDATGSGGFAEWLIGQGTGTIYLIWQPTSSSSPKAEYKCRAARPARGGDARNPLLCTVSLLVESVTDTFPT